MTPLQIRMMLHYYAIAKYGERDHLHANSPAVFEQRGYLIRDGLIEADETSGSGYRATDRGVAYVELLCQMPLPIQKWVPAGMATLSA